MLDLFLLLSIGFFTLLPAFFFFGLFLMIIGMGVYYGLSQIISYKKLMLGFASAQGSVKKHLSEFHFPDSWHIHH